MPKKKKNKNLGPKRKRMSRRSRLQSTKVKEWVEKYEGKNIIKGYAKWYAVDLICAMNEVEMLGHSISESTKEKTKKAVEDRNRQKRLQKEKRKQKRELLDMDFDSDETFAFIVGYTSGGVPYGITYVEMEEIEKNEPKPIGSGLDDEFDWEIDDLDWDDGEFEDDWTKHPDDDEYELTNDEIEELLLTKTRKLNFDNDDDLPF